MFIQTEETPNPMALKFLPGLKVSPNNPVFFENIEEAEASSFLAVQLLLIKGVKAVFFGYNFITVTKSELFEWKLLKPKILMIIMDHCVAGHPIFDKHDSDITVAASKYQKKNMSKIEKQIVEIIDNRIRPAVAMDGGDIVYKGFNKGIVYLELKGACSGCPSSTITLKNGIESMLQHFIPEIISVESI